MHFQILRKHKAKKAIEDGAKAPLHQHSNTEKSRNTEIQDFY